MQTFDCFSFHKNSNDTSSCILAMFCFILHIETPQKDVSFIKILNYVKLSPLRKKKQFNNLIYLNLVRSNYNTFIFISSLYLFNSLSPSMSSNNV